MTFAPRSIEMLLDVSQVIDDVGLNQTIGRAVGIMTQQIPNLIAVIGDGSRRVAFSSQIIFKFL